MIHSPATRGDTVRAKQCRFTTSSHIASQKIEKRPCPVPTGGSTLQRCEIFASSQTLTVAWREFWMGLPGWSSLHDTSENIRPFCCRKSLKKKFCVTFPTIPEQSGFGPLKGKGNGGRCSFTLIPSQEPNVFVAPALSVCPRTSCWPGVAWQANPRGTRIMIPNKMFLADHAKVPLSC